MRKPRRGGRWGDDYRRKLGSGAAILAGWLETLLAVVVLIALVASCIPTLREMFELFTNSSSSLFHEFLASVLNLVIGVEFIEMLTKHNPGSMDNLLSVLAIAVIFLIRKFAFSESFGEDEEEGAEKETPDREKT